VAEIDMRLLILTACLLTAAAPLTSAAQSQGERPLKASVQYRGCAGAAATNADHRACLAAEVAFGRDALRSTAIASGIDAVSQRLWQQSMEHDCSSEGRMGGNAADMRQMACEIEAMADRADYLLRRGHW
jgi:hypothetical protein